MEEHQVFNNGPRGVHNRRFCEKITTLTDEIKLYEDEQTRLVLQANLTELPIPLTQYAPHFPGLAHTKIQRLEELAQNIHEGLADIKQTTHYKLHRDFGSIPRKPHEFIPQTTQASKTTDLKKYLLLANEFHNAINLTGSIWQTRTYNTFTRKTYLAATRFSLIEHHKKSVASTINPGKKTTHTYTRYLNILPH